MNESADRLPPDLRPVAATSAGLSLKDLGDELLVYDPGSDRVHVLNGTARELYLLADGSRSVAALVTAFLERYEVDPGEGERAVHETLTRLVELGLLRAA